MNFNLRQVDYLVDCDKMDVYPRELLDGAVDFFLAWAQENDCVSDSCLSVFIKAILQKTGGKIL